MRIIATIKERLERNAQQRRRLVGMELNQELPRKQQIRLEYLRIEAQTYQSMLGQLRNRRWYWPKSRKIKLAIAVALMSFYVLGIFYMFKEMDLSKVEQWQFAATTLPFWLIITLVPVAIITFLTSRNTRI